MAYTRKDYAGLITSTTLNGAINNSVTALTLTSATGWPTVDDGGNYAIIDPGLATEEKILVTARTGTTCGTVTRGVDGSTAYAHASGAEIMPIGTAVDLDEANYMVAKTVGLAAASGDILVATAANTLAKLAAGSASTVLTTNSAGTVGYEQLTAAEIAGNAATNAKLAGMTRGTVKVGSAAGAASDLALGASGTFLKSDGTDATWAVISGSWTYVVKSADENKTDSSAADSELTFTTTNGSWYLVDLFAIMARTTGANFTSYSAIDGGGVANPVNGAIFFQTGYTSGVAESGSTGISSPKTIVRIRAAYLGTGGVTSFVWGNDGSGDTITTYAKSFLRYKTIS